MGIQTVVRGGLVFIGDVSRRSNSHSFSVPDTPDGEFGVGNNGDRPLPYITSLYGPVGTQLKAIKIDGRQCMETLLPSLGPMTSVGVSPSPLIHNVRVGLSGILHAVAYLEDDGTTTSRVSISLNGMSSITYLGAYWGFKYGAPETSDVALGGSYPIPYYEDGRPNETTSVTALSGWVHFVFGWNFDIDSRELVIRRKEWVEPNEEPETWSREVVNSVPEHSRFGPLYAVYSFERREARIAFEQFSGEHEPWDGTYW